MSALKEKLHASVEQLPSDISMEDAIYRLYVMQKIDRAEDDIANGRVLSHEQAMAEIEALDGSKRTKYTPKELVQYLLEKVPDNISWKQLQHEIWTIEQIEIGMDEVDRGETIPHEQVMKEMEKWLNPSSGRPKRKKISEKYSITSKKTPLLTLNESARKYAKKSR